MIRIEERARVTRRVGLIKVRVKGEETRLDLEQTTTATTATNTHDRQAVGMGEWLVRSDRCQVGVGAAHLPLFRTCCGSTGDGVAAGEAAGVAALTVVCFAFCDMSGCYAGPVCGAVQCSSAVQLSAVRRAAAEECVRCGAAKEKNRPTNKTTKKKRNTQNQEGNRYETIIKQHVFWSASFGCVHVD